MIRVPTGSSLELLVGHDDHVARWVGAQVGIKDFGSFATIGILRAGELIAGAVFNNYRQTNIEVTFASSTPRWCSRGVLRGLFRYPFEQLGLSRLTAVTESTNTSVRAFLCHLGFKEEGVMRRAFRTGADQVIFGMLREECRWLESK